MKNRHPTDELLCFFCNCVHRLPRLVALIFALTMFLASDALAKDAKHSDSGKKPSSRDEQPKDHNNDKKDRDDDGKHCDDKHCNNGHHNHPKPPKPPKPPKDRAGLPAAPTGLAADAVTLFQVNLTWADNSTNELGFKIERSLDGRNFTQIAQVLPNTTTYCDLNRFPDTAYFYRARAFNARGGSAYSAVARAQTPAPECELSTTGWQSWYNPIVPDESKTAVALAAGKYHGLALHADGTVTSWGIEPGIVVDTPPINLSNVVAIAAAGTHSLALLKNGTVIGWGTSFYGAEHPPANLSGVVAISTSENHSLALKRDGTVLGWGCDLFGATIAPTNLTGVVAIAAGSAHSLALKSDGTVIGWGSNDSGRAEPPPNLTNVIGIAAGAYHSMALLADRIVVSWGGFWTPVTPPTNLTNVIAIAAGSDSSFALTMNGDVVQWGWVHSGWFPHLYLNTQHYLIDAKSIVAGDRQFLALTPRPNSPTIVGLKVVATNKVAINWRDTSFGRNSFLVERSSVVGDYGYGDWLTIANLGYGTTNFLDTTVTNDGRYWYRVGAYNACHAPLPSGTQIVAVTSPTNTPYLQGNAFADQARLSGYFNNNGATSYRVERAPDVSGNPGSWSQILTNDISDYPNSYQYQSFEFVDRGLPVNTTNWYRLQVFNGLGASPYSEPFAVAILPPRQPLYPYARIADSNQVQITWYGQYPNDHSGFLIERTTNAPGTEVTWVVIGTETNTPYNGSFFDRDVKAGWTYRYRIRAFNVLGYSIPSIETEIKIIPPPAPSISGTPFANNIRLEWNNAGYQGRIERFKVERAKSEAGVIGQWSEIATVENPIDQYWLQYEDRELLPDSTYLYRIRALNWVGISPYSVPISVTIVRPVAPQITDISIGTTNSVMLRWQANTPLDQDGFRIERAPDASGTPGNWTQIGSVRTTNVWSADFTDSNVVANLTYWYRVRAFNGAGLSDYSPPRQFTTTPPINTYLSVYQDTDRVRVNVNSTEAGVLGFKIERALETNGTAGAWDQIANVPAISYSSVSITDSNLTPLATYWYRARAYNWIGDSVYSAAAKVSILPPKAPMYYSALIGQSNRVDLAWFANAPSTNTRVERALNVGGIPGAWTELQGLIFTNFSNGFIIDLATRTSDRTVEIGKSYSYRMRVFDIIGYSDYTAPITVHVVRPPAPLSLTASTFADWVRLSWNSEFNTYGHVDNYEVERAIDVVGSPGGWTRIATVPVAETVLTDDGLQGNTTYWYRVRAINWVGASLYSTTVSVRVLPPKPPQSVVAKLGITNQVKLEIYASYPRDQSGFTIERAADVGGNPGSWNEIGMLPAINFPDAFIDTNAIAYTTNWYRVRAFSSTGVSAYSDALQFFVGPPPAPIQHSPSQFADRVNLSWYDYTSGDVGGFKVERALDVGGNPGAWTQIAQVSATNSFSGWWYAGHTDTGLSVGNYWYRIRAYNWVGDSDASTQTPIAILGPRSPNNLSAQIGQTNQVRVEWFPGDAGVDGYYLERATDAGGAPGVWSPIATILKSDHNPEFTDTNLTRYTTNWYRVRSFNVLGISPYSLAVESRLVPPPPPNFYRCDAIVNRAYLEWQFNSASYGLVNGYNVQRAPDVGGVPGTWTEVKTIIKSPYSSDYETFVDTNLTANATYWYRVYIYNWLGEGNPSTARRITIDPPMAPTELSTYVRSSNSIEVLWNAHFRMDQDGFKLERSTDNQTTWTEIAIVLATNKYHVSYLDTNPVVNVINSYRVRAFNVVGYSTYSDVIRAIISSPVVSPISALVALPSPHFTQLTITNDSVLLTWTATGGTTNVVEASAQPTDNFVPVSPNIILTGSGSVTNNYLDVGALTNSASRFYRIRLVP